MVKFLSSVYVENLPASASNSLVVSDLGVLSSRAVEPWVFGSLVGDRVAVTDPSGGLTTDSDLVWKSATNVLGIRVANPLFPLHVGGEARIEASGTFPRLFLGHSGSADAGNFMGLEVRLPSTAAERPAARWYSNFSDINDATRTSNAYIDTVVAGVLASRYAIVAGKHGFGTTGPASQGHFFENNDATNALAGLTVEQAGTGDALLQWVLTGQLRCVAGIDNTDNRWKLAVSADLSTGTVLDVDPVTRYTRVGTVELKAAAPLHVTTGVSGLASPGADGVLAVLEAPGAQNGLRFSNPAGAVQTIYFGDALDSDAGAIAYNHASDRMQFRVNGATAASIESDLSAVFNNVVTASGGLATTRQANWDTVPTGAVMQLYSGAAANPTGDGTTTHFGLFVPHGSSNGYGFQVAARNQGLYYRGREAGSWGSWQKLWHAGNDGAGSGLDADLLDGQGGTYYRDLANSIGTTDNVTEGASNKYFSNALARAAISGASGRITYNSTSGLIDIDNSYAGQASIVTVGTLTTGTWQGASISTTYTDAKVTSVSAGAGLSVNASVGAVTVSMNHLGLQALSAPGADRVVFYDQTTGSFQWLTMGDNLTISGTTLNAATGGSYTAGTGLQLIGTQFSNTDRGSDQSIFKNVANVNGSTKFSAGSNNDTIQFHATGAASVAFDNVNKRVTISSTDTNTTYSAGDGLQLSGTTFNVDMLGIEDLSSPGVYRLMGWHSVNNRVEWFQAGNGVSLTGPQIENTDRGSSQNIFKNIANSAGITQFSADSNNTTLQFAAGGGTSIAFSPASKKITISSTDTNTTYSAGTGLQLTGTTFSNTDRGSTQNIFKNIANAGGADLITAASNNASLQFAGAGGITIAFDNVNKRVTIDGSGVAGGSGGGNVTGLSWNDTTGVLTLTQNAGTSPITVDLDGRYGGLFSVTDITGGVELGLDDTSGYDLDVATFTGAGNIAVDNIGGLKHIRIDDTEVSDARLKRDVVFLKGALKQVEELAAYSFRWKKDGTTGAKHNGFIAQEVMLKIPSASRLGNHGFYGINQRELVPVLWAAVRELSEKVRGLESDLQKVRSQLN